MVAFNRLDSKLRAIQIKQRRARIQAKIGHSDMKLKHPDWCRDAAAGKYIVMDKKIREDAEKIQIRNERFRSKLHVPI